MAEDERRVAPARSFRRTPTSRRSNSSHCGRRADLPACTALGDTAKAGCAAAVEMLLDAGADPARTWDGLSAAELAKHGHVELARRLTRAVEDR